MKSDDWRYERKFFIEDCSKAEVINSIKQHPAVFSDVFHSRQVNNIYFDSLGFKHYVANIEGVAEREKVRVRWYGARLGEIKNPVLEFKIKNGHLGRKEYYPLENFFINEKAGTFDLLSLVKQATLPPRVQYEIRSLLPRLANSYIRQYYMSADQRFRLTLDTGIRFFQVDHLRSSSFREQYPLSQSIVMELKYFSSEKIDFDAREVANGFRFRVTKNSKYVGGINKVYFGY
jgi:SPX domain protein involved in polyphosphate accumulation